MLSIQQTICELTTKRLLRLCVLIVASILFSTNIFASTAQQDHEDGTQLNINFWNGNKTTSRQLYEREILVAALTATEYKYGKWQLRDDTTDYPLAEDESSIFRSKNFDVFATVAGNLKLANEQKITIPIPLMKGLLGYRILIIRDADREKFSGITNSDQLQKLRLGIPSTWADAELFRQNGYQVVEKGGFDELFTRLQNNEFDYVSFGANEVEGVFSERATLAENLTTESSLLVYYPFPIIFYVNPNNPALAKRITEGLTYISKNGTLDKIFNSYYGETIDKLKLKQRTMITLKNPILPSEMIDFKLKF